MRRETQNVMLILLGGAILKIAINGQYLRYVKPSLQPWLIIAGAATVLYAVVGIVSDLRRGSARAAAVHDSHDPLDADPHGHALDSHGYEHGSRSPWLLLLPALAIFLVAPPALGADKVVRTADRSVVTKPADSTEQFRPLPSDDAPLLRIGDAVTRAVWDTSGTLDGRQIRLVGFTVRTPDGNVDLVRFVVSCCAADAQPVKVKMAGDTVTGYQSDTWLEVRGEMVPHTATEDNGYVPTFRVTCAQEIPAPNEPYEA